MKCSAITRKGKKCSLISKSQGLCHIHLKCSNQKVFIQFISERPERCPVCYDDLDKVESALECGHWIHLSCIEKWGVNQCPLCRTELNLTIESNSMKGWEAIEREIGRTLNYQERRQLVIRLLRNITRQ